MNLAALIRTAAGRLGDRTALQLDDARLTYRALDAMSARVAALLAGRGIGVGDRVAVMLPNVPEFAVVYYGILRAGAIVVPLDPLLKKREIGAYVGDCAAALLIAWHAYAEVAEAGTAATGTDCLFVVPDELRRLLRGVPADRSVRSRGPGDTAVLLYTAGTTGSPKGIELTHGNLAFAATTVARTHALGVDDVVLGALPLYHAYGQTCALNATLSAGGRLTLLRRFEPRAALDVIVRDGVTIFHGVPAMYIALLDQPGVSALSSLRACVTAGAAMPTDVLRAYERDHNCVIFEGYGLSETSIATASRAGARRPGTVGRPLKDVEMRVVDTCGRPLPPGATGEIVIRGPNIMKGYWNHPDRTATSDGWFHTGDLGRVDEDGFFSIVGRMRDVIIRGGYTVHPRELEEVLHEHPAVREAAVIGTPHPELGEEITAVVVLRTPVPPETLRDFVKERVAAYKYPRHIHIVDHLPTSRVGKVLKRALEPQCP